jgi:two-component system chemotaxis sensor kinase CheA
MTQPHQDKAVSEFLAEGEDILEGIGKSLIELEDGMKSGAVNPEVINAVFRGAHSLKGLSGMLGFFRVSELSHTLENLLDNLRLGKLALSGAVVDCLFESLETLNRLVAKISEAGDDDMEMGSTLSCIDAILSGGDSEKTPPEATLGSVQLDASVLEVLTEYEEHRLSENIRQGARLYEIQVTLDLTTFDDELQELTKSLGSLGEVITTLPSASDTPESTIRFNLIIGTPHGEAELRQVITSDTAVIQKIQHTAEVKPAPGPAVLLEERAPERTAGTPESFTGELKGLTKTVRVDINKLDALMNSVGDLIQKKNMLYSLAWELKKESALAGPANDLLRITDAVDRKLQELQEGVLDVRMIPIGQIFNRMARIVRKLSNASGKRVNFKTSGEDTELDKLVIEDMADPLMHIIRNAIDHGIEPPEERERLNKPIEGTIRLDAYQKGNHVVVQLTDDGAGIDPQQVYAKAQAKGLVDIQENLDEEHLLKMLCLPGFSTANEVTEVSGRGVGMDVVKKNISALGGVIDIQTEVGQGTSFFITLPITLAIIPALIVRCSTQTFAIPLNAVSENLIVPGDSLKTVEQKEVIRLRGRTLSLLRLQEIFQLPPADNPKNKTHIVVAGLAEKKIGIIVDEFLDKQEIVIKSIGSTLKKIPGIAGATETADKRARLVLDVSALIEEATQGVQTA